MQGWRCHFISMSGKSPTKLEVASQHDHSWDVKHQIKLTNFPNLKFQTSSHFLWPYISVCVRPGRKPGRHDTAQMLKGLVSGEVAPVYLESSNRKKKQKLHCCRPFILLVMYQKWITSVFVIIERVFHKCLYIFTNLLKSFKLHKYLCFLFK